MVVPIFGISISYETVFILNFFDLATISPHTRSGAGMTLDKKGKLLGKNVFPYTAAYRGRQSDPASRAADCEVNRLNAFLTFISAHWLSLLLIAGLLVAIGFVYKHKNKYAKNEFE